MLLLYISIFISFSQDLLPYPFIKHALNTLNFKANEKLELNKKINLDNNTIKVDLDASLSISISNSSFILNKLPDTYLLETHKGNYILSGKGRVLKFKTANYVLEFIEGQIFVSFIDETIKLIVQDKTQVYLIKEDEKIKLETKNYYLIENEKLTKQAFNNYTAYIDKVYEIDIYKNLIKEDKSLNNEFSKNKGKVIFCIKNTSDVKIDTWHVNNNIVALSKAINEKKYLNICKNKYKDIVSAGEYEVYNNNCLYINNNFCQDLKINNEVQLINITAILLIGYTKVFIKTKEDDFFEINSKWFFLKEGTYTLKLGKKLDKAILYEEKKIVLKGSKKIIINEI